MDYDNLTPAEIELLLFPPAEQTATEDPGGTRSIAEGHRAFATELTKSLAVLVGASLDVSVSGSNRQLFGEYLLGAPREGCFHWVRLHAELGHIILELPKAATGLILEAMLGSLDGSHVVARLPVTEIEHRLIAKAVGVFLACFEEAWQTIAPLSVSSERSQSDCLSMPLAAPDCQINVVRFQLSIANNQAEFCLCLPEDWPLSLIEHRVAQRPSNKSQRSGGQEETDEVEADQLDIVVRLAETTMTSDELAGLSVGDIITTDKDVGETLIGMVNGRPAFRANLGKVGDKKAVQIVETCDTAEPDSGASPPGTDDDRPSNS